MSGDAQAALAGRITAFRASGDAGVLLDEQALAEVAVLRTAMGWPASGPLPPGADVRRGLKAAVTIGTFRWLRSQVLPPDDGLEDLLEAAELLTAAREISPRSIPRPVARTLAAITGHGRAVDHAGVHDRAIDVLSAGTRSGELAAIDHAIVLLTTAARAAADDRYQPYYLSDLGTAWLDRFAITGRAADLEHGLAAHDRALAVPVPAPEDQAGLLANYSAALLAQFEQTGNAGHLGQAIATARMAADLARSAAAPPPTARAPSKSAPASAGPRAAGPVPRIPGPASDRAAAVRLAQLSSLSRLRAALLASYEEGTEQDLDEAMRVAGEAASLVPPGDPAYARYQSNRADLRSRQAARRTGSGPAGPAADIA